MRLCKRRSVVDADLTLVELPPRRIRRQRLVVAQREPAARSDRFAADAWLRRLPLRRIRRQVLHFCEGIGKRGFGRLRQSEIRTASQGGNREEGEGLVHETTPVVGRESSSGMLQ